MIHDPKLQLQDPITPNRLGKNRGGKEMSAPSISGYPKFAQKPTSSTPSAMNGRRDEVQNPVIPEQRKVGMRAIIKGLKNSIRQTFQNMSQGNNSENIENSIKIIYSTSLIFNSQNILLGFCSNSSFHFSNGHSRTGAALAGEFPVFPLRLAVH